MFKKKIVKIITLIFTIATFQTINISAMKETTQPENQKSRIETEFINFDKVSRELKANKQPYKKETQEIIKSLLMNKKGYKKILIDIVEKLELAKIKYENEIEGILANRKKFEDMKFIEPETEKLWNNLENEIIKLDLLIKYAMSGENHLILFINKLIDLEITCKGEFDEIKENSELTKNIESPIK